MQMFSDIITLSIIACIFVKHSVDLQNFKSKTEA